MGFSVQIYQDRMAVCLQVINCELVEGAFYTKFLFLLMFPDVLLDLVESGRGTEMRNKVRVKNLVPSLTSSDYLDSAEEHLFPR